MPLLSWIVSKVTKNFQPIRDCLRMYYRQIMLFKQRLEIQNDEMVINDDCLPFVKRAVGAVGLLMQYFDFKDAKVRGNLPVSIPLLLLLEIAIASGSKNQILFRL